MIGNTGPGFAFSHVSWNSLKTVKIRPLQTGKEVIIWNWDRTQNMSQSLKNVNALKAKINSKGKPYPSPVCLFLIRGIQTQYYFIVFPLICRSFVSQLRYFAGSSIGGWAQAWCVHDDVTFSHFVFLSPRGGRVLPEGADPQLCSRLYNWQGWPDHRTTAERDGCHY